MTRCREVVSRATRARPACASSSASSARLARKVTRRIAAKEIDKLTLDRADVRPLLGRPRVHPEKANQADEIGVATGMYYTPAGGDIMFVEAVADAGTRATAEHPAAARSSRYPDRPARRRDEGVGARGVDLRTSHANALDSAEDRLGSRRPRPRAGRRDPERRAVGGHGDGDGDRVGAVGRPARKTSR